MGVAKFDSTGKFIYHSAIFDGAPFPSMASRGMFVYVFDNKVFYFGDLQRRQPVPASIDYSNWNDVYMVATDTGSVFNPYRLQKTRATYQESGDVLDIVNYSTGKYAVLKQLGLSASVEMRDSRQGNVLWTQNLQRGFYLAADKLCITADNKIAVTAISHDHAATYYQHSVKPDSLYLFRFDSTGTLKQENRYVISQDVDFRSIQLYPSMDTNLVLIFSQVDRFGNDNSIHLYNFDKGTGNIGDYGDYLSSVYAPVPGKQRLFYPASHDTAMHFQYYSPYSAGSQLLYKLFTFKNTGGGGWSDQDLKLTGLTYVVHNITPCDSTSVIALATSNANGASSLIHYNVRQRSTIWTVTDAAPGYSMDMGSCSTTSIYLAGRKGNSLVVRKARVSDGSVIWEKTIAPVGANQYYIPKDQKFNTQRNQYTIAGYIADTTVITPMQSAFYLTVDTNGTIVNQWTQAGDYKVQNSLNVVNVSQFGQTLIGGALYKSPYGRSGVFIEADSAITLQTTPVMVTIGATPGDSACSGDSVILVAYAAGCSDCSYSWSTSPTVAGDTLIVKASGTYTVTAGNGTVTGSATQAVTIVSVVKPTISLSNAVLTASSASGDQWYLNGQALVGSNSQQLKPGVSGEYTVQVMQGGCQSPISDAFAYTVTTTDSSFAVIITADPADTICAGDSVKLTANVAGCGNCTYSWSVAPVVRSASLIVKAAGSYTVTVTNDADTASAVHSVVIKPRPARPEILGIGGQLSSTSPSGNQWYWDGILLRDSVGQRIRPSVTGLYSLEVTQDGCPSPMSTSFPYIAIVTNIDSSSQDSVTFYPNPVKDILHFANKSQRAIHIGLYDMNGNRYVEISSSTTGTGDINMSSYAPGEYYVMITDSKTGKQTSMVILKL